MKGIFVGVENDSALFYRQPENIYEHSVKKCIFSLEDITFTRYDLIPPKQGCTFTEEGEFMQFRFSQTKDLYLAVIYAFHEVSKKNVKTFKLYVKSLLHRSFKKIRLSSCYFSDNYPINAENLGACIGEVLICVKKFYFLRFGKDEIASFHDALSSNPLSKSYGYIKGSNEYYILAIVDDSKAEIHSKVAVFYQINSIDPAYAITSFIGQRVKILVYKDYSIIKLAKAPKIFELVTIPAVELIPDRFPAYLHRTDIDSTQRLSITSTAFYQQLPNSIVNECIFISMPSMNKDFGSVIALAIIEHYYRFPQDTAFKNNIEKLFAGNSNFFATYNEIVTSLPKDHGSFSALNQLIKDQYFGSISGFGCELQKLIKADILTISGWQELSNRLGVTLKVIDFTRFEAFNLIPLSDCLDFRPIFRLGIHYTNFFLYYSQEIMQYDGYTFPQGQGIPDFPNQTYPLPMQYPFYDFKPKNVSTTITHIFDSLIEKVSVINDIVLKKAKGITPLRTDVTFDEVVKSISEYSENIGDKNLDMIGQRLRDIDFTSSIYAITPAKFRCLCCSQEFDPQYRVRYICGCEFDIGCNNQYVGSACQCRRSTLVQKSL